MAVIDRPSLYNYRLNIKERSKLKKSALWEEVKNIVGGTVKYYKLCWMLQMCYLDVDLYPHNKVSNQVLLRLIQKIQKQIAQRLNRPTYP